MILLEENNYLNIFEISESKILKLVWKASSEELNYELDEYKNLILMWANKVENYQPNCVLVNTIYHLVTIPVEMQTWFANEIFPKYSRSKMTKLAFIVSQDFMSQLSIEQAMEEDKNVPFVTHYFVSETEALNWLLQEEEKECL